MSTMSGRAPSQRDGFVAVGRLPHDLDVGLRVEEGTETGPHEGLVVGEHDRDHSGPDGQASRDPEAAAGARCAASSIAAERFGSPLAHARRCRCRAAHRHRIRVVDLTSTRTARLHRSA